MAPKDAAGRVASILYLNVMADEVFSLQWPLFQSAEWESPIPVLPDSTAIHVSIAYGVRIDEEMGEIELRRRKGGINIKFCLPEVICVCTFRICSRAIGDSDLAKRFTDLHWRYFASVVVFASETLPTWSSVVVSFVLMKYFLCRYLYYNQLSGSVPPLSSLTALVVL